MPREVPDPEAVSNRAASSLREPWFAVSCCPTNIARTFASLGSYLATVDSGGLQLHQYADSRISTSLDDGRPVGVEVNTGYPHRGKVSVRVTESGSDPWSLTFRVPSWATDAWLTDQGQRKRVQPGTAAVTRAFSVDDMVELEMAMSPRWTFPDRRIDSVRGCVAVERGPLVLCVESVDLPQGVEVDMIGIDPAGGLEDSGSAVTATGSLLDVRADGWPYREFPDRGGPGGDLALPLVPYHSWANRGPSTMRVWVPQVHAGI